MRNMVYENFKYFYFNILVKFPKKMSSSHKNTIDILYNKKLLFSYPFTPSSTIKDLKKYISEKYFINSNDIILLQNASQLKDDKAKLSSLINISKKIEMNNIISKFKFCQMENESNFFDLDVDIFDTTIEQFEILVSSFFKQKMDEFNFNISKFEFFDEAKPFFDKNKIFHMHFKEKYREPKFYFLIKDCAMHFNSKNYIEEKYEEDIQNIEEEENNNNINDKIEDNKKSEKKEENKEISLRKDVESGKIFKIIIQTYNHLIKEIEVYPEMTINNLKDLIEKNFMVSKEHQELLYLVYKLDEDEKMLKDYYIRPNGTVFLRGYYFPIVFVDYFNKKNKNVVSINIAEQIKYIRKKIITLLNLEDNYNYKLMLNGKTLDDDDYLINSNVQRMQMIYFK